MQQYDPSAQNSIEGNEKADKKAKKGAQQEGTYFTTEDLEQYQNKIDLQAGEKTVRSNYRKNLKQKHQNEITEEAKKDRNKLWKKLNSEKWNESLSNDFLRNKQIHKGIARTIIKARTDTLPHAANMLQRKCENITSAKCPMCGKREDTKHILLDCKTYNEIREKNKRGHIQVNTTKNRDKRVKRSSADNIMERVR